MPPFEAVFTKVAANRDSPLRFSGFARLPACRLPVGRQDRQGISGFFIGIITFFTRIACGFLPEKYLNP